jgi:hypothetical protein
MTKATQLLFRAVEVIPGKIMTVRLRFCPGLGSCRVYLFGWLIKKPFGPPPPSLYRLLANSNKVQTSSHSSGVTKRLADTAPHSWLFRSIPSRSRAPLVLRPFDSRPRCEAASRSRKGSRDGQAHLSDLLLSRTLPTFASHTSLPSFERCRSLISSPSLCRSVYRSRELPRRPVSNPNEPTFTSLRMLNRRKPLLMRNRANRSLFRRESHSASRRCTK